MILGYSEAVSIGLSLAKMPSVPIFPNLWTSSCHNTHLTTILVECARAGVRKKDCRLGQMFKRLRARMGCKKALMAIARKLLLIIFWFLRGDRDYQEPEPSKADKKAKR